MDSANFRARLVRPTGVGTWTFAYVPKSAVTSVGLLPRMRVAGTIDRVPFRSSLIPRGGGKLFIVIAGPLRAEIAKTAGQRVEISLRRDPHPVVIKLPTDFRTALGRYRSSFDRMAPSYRKAYIIWVEGAKLPATRRRRIARSVRMIRGGLKLK